MKIIYIITWTIFFIVAQGCNSPKHEINCTQEYNEEKLKFWIDSFEYNSTSKEIHFTNYYKNTSPESYYIYLGDLYSDWVNHDFALNNPSFSQNDNRLLSIGTEISPPIVMPEDYIPRSLDKVYTLIKAHEQYEYDTIYLLDEKQEKYIMDHLKIEVSWRYGDNINNRLDGITKRHYSEEENLSNIYLKDYDTSICLWQGQKKVMVVCERESIDKEIYRFSCVEKISGNTNKEKKK